MRITATQIVKNVNLTTTQEVVRRIITVAPLGERGFGVPAGGTTGQVPSKQSDADYDIIWVDPESTGGGIPDAPNNANAYVRSGLAWVIGYTKTAIDNLLTNYATQSWVNSQGFITNVVTALGFTPYSATNPNGYTANDTDANLKNRANHIGTQLASTISDFNSASDARVVAGITGKQDTLVSGTNIRTINGVSVLGSEDLVVSGGGGETTSGTYIGTIAVTGTTAPSGATNHSFTFTQVDKLVSLRINLDYGVAGLSITAIACELPAGCPTPALPSGVSVAGEILNYGSGNIHTAKSIAISGLPFCALRLKSTSPNVFEVVVTRVSGNFRYGYFSINYFCI